MTKHLFLPRWAAPAALVCSIAVALGCTGRTAVPPVAASAPYPIGADGVQTWYLSAAGARQLLQVRREAQAGAVSAVLQDESGSIDRIDHFTWEQSSGQMSFRRAGASGWGWYRVRVVDGVMVGRLAIGEAPSEPPPAAYTAHVTGWSHETFNRDIVPRVYELMLDDDQLARLRLDRSTRTAGIVGTLKIYSSLTYGAQSEGLEYDVHVRRWDGADLEFSVQGSNGTTVYTGVAEGRAISGHFVDPGALLARPFQGTRAEVLGYGLTGKPADSLLAWQVRTRLRLQHLIMAGAPAPLTTSVTRVAEHLPPLPSFRLPSERDDDADRWPQRYERSELRFDFTLPNQRGEEPIARAAHASLLRPTTPPPPGGYPVAVALNGHGGSGARLTDPDDELYWYGDSFARRGFVVLALDIGHRPVGERGGLYLDLEDGDDPGSGNGPHPSIKAPGFDSDWEEDGERTWDVMRAIDYVQGLPNVDLSWILVTGLSLGGEISTLAGALDPRVTMTIAAGFSPDLGVMLHHSNHPCWQWVNADIREYLDVSDLQALNAPRPLVLQTGKADDTFSALKPPFASDKQVVRRSRAAYQDAPDALIHYMHYDRHHYHVGDFNPTYNAEAGVQIPAISRPILQARTTWQTDDSTLRAEDSLYRGVEDLLRSPPR